MNLHGAVSSDQAPGPAWRCRASCLRGKSGLLKVPARLRTSG